jgi:uncharacterized lipoprotein YajG
MKNMKAILAVAAFVVLAGCAYQNQCVQPDPVQPASKCWNKGVNCAEPMDSVNK